jgi:phenylpropionate dioxygenase-like ring-hydroxylating dioxygenase large terminal subunit
LTDTTDAFLRRAEAELDSGLVAAEIFNDAGIHALELERIFGRCWVFLGLESEIPEPGDYRLRRIGEDPFILVRDAGGEVRVLFNACRHRGGTVCRTDAGNTTVFRCPYHAWTYDTTGNLVAVPSRQTAYQALDLSQWGLLAAPRVASYAGLVFATLDPAAPALEDYLGRFRWYLDIQLHLTAGGMELLGEPHRWRVEADWKSGAENFTGDSSHTHMTHRSLLKLGLVDDAAAGRVGEARGIHVNDCDGHAISMRLLGPGHDVYFGYPEELWDHVIDGPLSPEQRGIARAGVVHDGTVFPNFSFIHIGGTIDTTKPTTGFLSLRVWQPRGPGRTEIWNWVLAPREASPQYKRLAYRAAMSTFSPSGHFEQDDTEVWSGTARSAATLFARRAGMRFNYQMGMPGMSDVTPMTDWPGPGTAWPSNAGESGLRAFHRRWIEQMRQE